jgi:ribosomal protein S18 acetylase RimI-like enzyme
MSATTPLYHIRPATVADIDALVAVHADAFNDKFMQAFGARKFHRGLALLAETWRRQGNAGLHGIWVVEWHDTIIGTIAVRARHTLRETPMVPVEWLFIRGLGFFRAMYALSALSVIDYSIRFDEMYISDVAVVSAYRRRGVAAAMLHHAEQEARRQHVKYLSLYVNARNRAARELYLKMGFQMHHMRRSLWAWVLIRHANWALMRKDVLTGDR